MPTLKDTLLMITAAIAVLWMVAIVDTRLRAYDLYTCNTYPTGEQPLWCYQLREELKK